MSSMPRIRVLEEGDDLLLQGFAASFCGRAFHHETTLRPDGDYHGVLHRLGLHEAEISVLKSSRPSDQRIPPRATSSAAQVSPRERESDEDLERKAMAAAVRPDPLGVELERAALSPPSGVLW